MKIPFWLGIQEERIESTTRPNKGASRREPQEYEPPQATSSCATLNQNIHPMSPFPLALVKVCKEASSRSARPVSIRVLLQVQVQSTTHPLACSLSFTFCQSFQRSLSLRVESRHFSLPGSSACGRVRSLSRHDGSAGGVAGAGDGFLSESELEDEAVVEFESDM